MMTQNADKKREQIQMFCMDDLVPQDHLLRLIDQAIDWSFIYDLVIDKYSADNGRPSMDPVMLIMLSVDQWGESHVAALSPYLLWKISGRRDFNAYRQDTGLPGISEGY